MHRSETRDLIRCANCKAEFSLGRERGFAATADSGLCFACASSRGGRYDAARDTWDPAPRLDGLPVLDEIAEW